MDERLSVLVGARITEFKKKMAEVNAIARTTAKDIVIEVETRTEDFERKMSRIANVIRTVQTISTNTFRGMGTAISSAAVPAVASLAGALASLAPMLATIGGAGIGLGAAFGVAGVGAGAFAGVATSNLKEAFEVREEYYKLAEKHAAETDPKKQDEIQKEMIRLYGSLDNESRKAFKSIDKLSGTWNDLSSQFKPQIVDMFSKSLGYMGETLQRLEPMFQGSVEAVSNLVDSLGKGLKSDAVTAIFETLNETAGPLLETLGKAAGYFTRGILNMLSAFAPLSRTTSEGFLNMAKSFDEWANGLWKSDKFAAFIDYVQTNGPKLNQIIGNIVGGLVGMFSAFAPLSADMTTGLVDLTARFKEWGQSLSSSEGFQKFVDYVKTNGPVLLGVLAQLGEFIINVGIALAPLGEQMLTIIESFGEWLNNLMETNPMVGKMIAYGTLLSGLFIALVPNIIAIGEAFGIISGVFRVILPLFTTIGGAIGRVLIPALSSIGTAITTYVIPFLSNMGTWIARLGTSLLTNGARMAAGWLIGMGPIGWITAAVIGLVALIIWKWDEIKAFTVQIWTSVSEWLSNLWTSFVTNAAILLAPLLTAITTIFNNTVNAGKQIWTTFTNTLSVIWQNIKNIASNAWIIIKNAILGPILLLIDLATGDFAGFASHLSQIWNNIKNAGQQIWQSLKNIVLALISGLVSSARTFITTLAVNLLTLWNGMKSTASNIWNNLKSSVVSIASGMVTSVVNFFQNLVNGVVDKMTSVYTNVVDLWGDAQSYLEDIDLSQIGKDIIQGLINGIGSMVSNVTSKIAEVAGNIKSGITGALNIHSPSRWMRDMVGKNIGAGMIVGMDAMRSKVNAASMKLAQAAMVEPQRTSLAFDTSLSSSDFGRVQHDFGAQMDDFELDDRQPAIINVNVGSKRIAREIVDDISRLQDKKVSNNAVYR